MARVITLGRLFYCDHQRSIHNLFKTQERAKERKAKGGDQGVRSPPCFFKCPHRALIGMPHACVSATKARPNHFSRGPYNEGFCESSSPKILCRHDLHELCIAGFQRPKATLSVSFPRPVPASGL